MTSVSASEERRLGEYRLKELLGETRLSRSWLAEQVSISRMVVVDELCAVDGQEREVFLADVRAKAAVDHPMVGSVYEAVSEPGLCFYAHELLPGTTLLERQKAGARMSPASLVELLRQLAEAQIQQEFLGHASSALDLDAIHLDSQGVVRLKNLAIAGERAVEQSARDIVQLGSRIPELVELAQAGSTRLLTLCGWMRGEGLDEPISWQQVMDFCAQIEQQLADVAAVASSPPRDAGRARKRPVLVISAASAVLLVGLGVVAIQLRPESEPPVLRAVLPEAVAVAAGEYATPDGASARTAGFKIAATEVTIGQYAEFLEILETLSQEGHEKIFDHAAQAASGKVTHVPDDWRALLAAAKANQIWQGQAVTLDSPLVGVDWWDAVAYAEWKKGRLPTQQEWFAALSSSVENPAEMESGPWLPVSSQLNDRTPSGLIGMAGSVCEWTAEPSPNPLNPLGEKCWVVIGGSYLRPTSNALSREWVLDRSLRRADLGFRLVFD
jgi:hypothetical protein